jgi:hypothetical protein
MKSSCGSSTNQLYRNMIRVHSVTNAAPSWINFTFYLSMHRVQHVCVYPLSVLYHNHIKAGKNCLTKQQLKLHRSLIKKLSGMFIENKGKVCRSG